MGKSFKIIIRNTYNLVFNRLINLDSFSQMTQIAIKKSLTKIKQNDNGIGPYKTNLFYLQ